MLLKPLSARKAGSSSMLPSLDDYLAQDCVQGRYCSAGVELPCVDSKLRLRDRLGRVRVRLGLRRSDYRVLPGLYALGSPDRRAPVVVTANYKLSFDHLRSALSGRSAWILVLDTKGVNVWCAAGKGSFGTEELLTRVRMSRLALHVDHRSLILPQLGATGVSAQRIYMEEKWRVRWGPVRAKDLPAYLDADCSASPEMRRIRFGLPDRLALVPNELMASLRPGALLCVAILFLGGLGALVSPSELKAQAAIPRILDTTLAMVGAGLSGLVLVPLLLPVLPFRAFSLKGASLGFLLVAGTLIIASTKTPFDWPFALALLLGVPAVVAQLALIFTGSSTYTSLSGVEKEVRLARFPVSIGLGVAAALLGLRLLGILK